MKKLLCILLCSLTVLPALVMAEEGPEVDKAPDLSNNPAALQRGARTFINYCLNCHSAQSMRYNRLRDLGLSEQQIKDNLLFTTDKVGDPMKAALQPKDAKAWFGVVPPDLSVMARAKGSDYIYTYLRSYYLDPSRPTGWNNRVFPNTGMPHVLYQLQGTRNAVFIEKESAENKGEKIHEFEKYETVTPGTESQADYDATVADLTAFMTYMAEPTANLRRQLGVWVLLFLGVFFVIAWRLNASFWKDVK